MSNLTADERLVLSGAEFQLDQDGDLEIDITKGTGSESWRGIFIMKEEATKLRDFLVRILP